MNFQATHKQRKIIMAASIAGLIGIFLPWQSFSVNLFGSGLSHGVNGFHGAGILALLSLVAALALSLIGQLSEPLNKNKWLGALAAGTVVILCAIVNMITTKTGSAGFIGMDIGIGCWITLVAGIGIIGAAWLFRKPGHSLKESLNGLTKSIPTMNGQSSSLNQSVAASEANKIVELEKIIRLKDAGHITEGEYLEMKSNILSAGKSGANQ